MKFQPASVKEIKRVSVGSAICLGLMLGVFYLLMLAGVGSVDYTVWLGGICGTLIAVLNFAMLCLTIQNATEISDKKQMKARFQLSYNARLLTQAAWVVAAFLLPWFHGVAAAVPLLFPTLVIFFLQSRGKLVTPSQRENPPPEENEEERLDSFEV